jgi:transposase
MSIATIGLDTAKSVFQVHAVHGAGQVVIRRKLHRDELLTFFEKQGACTVVMEACGAAHHWGRALTDLGHTVRLVAPEAVRPFVKRGKKNDAADAAAICEAASRPGVTFVPIKSLEPHEFRFQWFVSCNWSIEDAHNLLGGARGRSGGRFRG